MNLHAIVRGAVSAISPELTVTLKRSTGYTTAADGTQVPAYASTTRSAQVQSLDGMELAQVDGIGGQGEKLCLYCAGSLIGSVRADGAGGDLVILPDGSTWLVVKILEAWARVDGWTKAAITRQNDTKGSRPLD
jgi:hypothetical protein